MTDQCEALGGGGPALDVGQAPLLHDLLGLLVHSHGALLGDAQQTRHQLVLALHLLLSGAREQQQHW